MCYTVVGDGSNQWVALPQPPQMREASGGVVLPPPLLALEENEMFTNQYDDFITHEILVVIGGIIYINGYQSFSSTGEIFIPDDPISNAENTEQGGQYVSAGSSSNVGDGWLVALLCIFLLFSAQ